MAPSAAAPASPPTASEYIIGGRRTAPVAPSTSSVDADVPETATRPTRATAASSHFAMVSRRARSQTAGSRPSSSVQRVAPSLRIDTPRAPRSTTQTRTPDVPRSTPRPTRASVVVAMRASAMILSMNGTSYEPQ